MVADSEAVMEIWRLSSVVVIIIVVVVVVVIILVAKRHMLFLYTAEKYVGSNLTQVREDPTEISSG